MEREGKYKGRKGEEPAWIFCPETPEFLVTPPSQEEAQITADLMC